MSLLCGRVHRLQRREPLRCLCSIPWIPPSAFDTLREVERRAFGASPEGVAELSSVVGVVIAWILPGSMVVRGCAMLLPAAVLSSCGRLVKPVAEGRHA